MIINSLKDARAGDIIDGHLGLYIIVSIDGNKITWLDIQRQIIFHQQINHSYNLNWHAVARYDTVSE
jgi:hypothetical protein